MVLTEGQEPTSCCRELRKGDKVRHAVERENTRAHPFRRTSVCSYGTRRMPREPVRATGCQDERNTHLTETFPLCTLDEGNRYLFLLG